MLKSPLVGVIRVNFSKALLSQKGLDQPRRGKLLLTLPPCSMTLLQPGPKSSAAFGQ